MRSWGGREKGIGVWIRNLREKRGPLIRDADKQQHGRADQEKEPKVANKKSHINATEKHAKTKGFSLVFKIFTCFVLFAKNAFLTAQALQQHFVKFAKKQKSENEYNLGNLICFSKILNATGVLQYVTDMNEKVVWANENPKG